MAFLPVRKSLPVPLGLVFLLLFLFPTVARSQMPEPYLSLGGRPWDPSCTCENAPGACSGGTLFPAYGMYEFSMSRVDWTWEPTERVPVTLHWPAGWTFLGYEVCYGTLESGDPSISNSPLVFSFLDCPIEQRAFFRIWLDCPTAGTLSATPSSMPSCWGYDVHEVMGLYVSIGDRCGLHGHGHCSLCGYRSESAYFSPLSYEITLPQTFVHDDTLGVSGDTGPYCGGLPECGCDGYGADFGGLTTNRDWMTVQMLDYEQGTGYRQMHYNLRIRTFGLLPGDYEGRVYAGGGCCTVEACIPVTLHIRASTGVESDEAAPVKGLTLGAPAPNPTSGGVSYSVSLPEAAPVRVLVFDAGGRLVGQALSGTLPAGLSWHTWSPSPDLLHRLSNGAYFLRMETARGRDSRMFVIRK